MEEHTKGYYKYCVVPMCENNTNTAPSKIYFHMPKNANIRKKWCKAMRRENVSCSSSLYCCEDHFDIEKDTKNYIQYKIMALEQGQKVSLLLKKGVAPHIFRCQRKNKLRLPPERKVLHRNQENITQEEHRAANELNQVHMTHKFRSEAIITEIEVNQTTSPFQPNLQSVCRVCLAFDVKMYDMRDFELSEMFQNITGIVITANNYSITEHLCWECAARLKAAVSFRNKALLSDALLQGLVTTGKEIQKTDITSIKDRYKNIKSNLSVHEVFHIVHIEEDGEEEQSSTSENIDAEIVQNTLTEGLIEFEDTKIGIKEENIETDITENIITDTTTHLEEESATPQNIDTETEQNTIPEESVAFEDTQERIKEENIETEIENYDESMVYIPIKTEDMEVDPFNVKEEKEDVFVDPLDNTLSGHTKNSIYTREVFPRTLNS